MGRSRVDRGDWETHLWETFPRYREALSYVCGQHCFGCIEGTCKLGPGPHGVNPGSRRGWPVSVECRRGHALRRMVLDADHNWHPYLTVYGPDERLRKGPAWGYANILPADRQFESAGHVCEQPGCPALLAPDDGPWCDQHEPPMYTLRRIEGGEQPEEGHSLDGTGRNQASRRTRARCHRCTYDGVHHDDTLVTLYARALQAGDTRMRLTD